MNTRFQIYSSPNETINTVVGKEHIEILEQYHGNIDSTKAQIRLKNKPNGTYLIRYSKNNNAYYVSLKINDTTKEIILINTRNI